MMPRPTTLGTGQEPTVELLTNFAKDETMAARLGKVFLGVSKDPFVEASFAGPTGQMSDMWEIDGGMT